jgi:hypothetical protein
VRTAAAGHRVDGELVVWSDGRLDFAALAPRLAYRCRRRPPAQLAPAAFLAFDVLAAGDVDVRREPWRVRRSLLEQLAGTWRPPLQPTPQTADPAQARQWLEEYAAADVGVEGLVAKGASQRYHTNVIACIGTDVAMIALEMIPDEVAASRSVSGSASTAVGSSGSPRTRSASSPATRSSCAVVRRRAGAATSWPCPPGPTAACAPSRSR